MTQNRVEITKELEEYFGKRVFAIVFNPNFEEGIVENDEFYFRDFILEIIKKENVKKCIFLLNGFGGNLKTAIACSQLLRNSLENYECLIPSSASSSVSYFVLQSNGVLLGENSIITQIDPVFEYDGEDLRAIKHLNDNNPRIKHLAKEFFNPVFNNLKRVVRTSPNVFEKEVVRESQNSMKYLLKVVDFWMGKDFHESGISLKELKTLKIKHKILPSEIIKKANELVTLCRYELTEEGYRFLIQTSNIKEEKYLGGFFHYRLIKDDFS